MRPVRLLLLGLAAALLLAGCGSLPVDVDDVHRHTTLTAADTRTDVQLSAGLLTLGDKTTFLGLTYTIASGKILRQVFAGNTTSPHTLDLVAHTMTLDRDRDNGMRPYCGYTLTVRLDTQGQPAREITVTVKGYDPWSYDRMMIKAVELAAKEIAAQIP